MNDLTEEMKREYESNNESPEYLRLSKRFTNLEAAYESVSELMDELWDAYNHRHTDKAEWERYDKLHAEYDGKVKAIMDAAKKANIEEMGD